MIKVTIHNKDITLTVEGLHKLWALKSEMVIPIEQIVGARLNCNEVTMPEGWRLPGTYIPELITAGTYRAHGDKVFWDVVHQEKSIIIDLCKNEYKQLILEVENPETVVAEINSRISTIESRGNIHGKN